MLNGESNRFRMLKHDIISEADIQLLVDSFYKKVIHDPIIGFIFTDVVQLSWEKHIPIMYAFWTSILLPPSNYHGNPMSNHFELDKKVQLTQEHFDKWLLLWEQTVNENFAGSKAEEAITRAKNIAAIMLLKIKQQRV